MPGEALSLDSVSIVMIWTAMAVYALAFVAYAFDLARRSSDAVDAKDATQSVRVAEPALVGAGGGRHPQGVSRGRASSESTALRSGGATSGKRYIMARIGTSLTVLGFLFHLG